jgi:non-specific serine/threonine protein kinase
MQAIDRTHRIGQSSKVFVYKAITKDSIEEKILELQEKKRESVEKIIVAEENFLKKLTPENILYLFK